MINLFKTLLTVAVITVTTAFSDVTIDEINFPDVNFREWTLSQIWGSDDSILATNEIAGITFIDVSDMNISNLTGIEHFTALITLDCYNNQLTKLDLSINTALRSLSCYNNYIPESSINERPNKINELNWATLPQYTFDNEAGITIDSTTFPDEIFRNWVLKQTWGADSAISDNDNSKITGINVSHEEITDLTGIEHFTNLTVLKCSYNQLTKLNLSANAALTNLNCDNNQLSKLILPEINKLTYLNCNNNRLTELDLSTSTTLTQLYCYNNYIPETNLKAIPDEIDEWNWITLPQFVFDDATETKINEITFPDYNFRNWALSQAWGADYSISNDDISKVIDVHVPHMKISNLTGIELFTALTSLDCSYNQLTELNVSANTALTHLICHSNQLTQLDVKENTALKMLWCENNYISMTSLPKTPVGIEKWAWVTLPQYTSSSISKIQKSNNRFGIRFSQNIVSDKAKISVVLPNNERVFKTEIIVYDITGNVIYSATSNNDNFVWDLRNSSGRTVFNGTYLVITEIKTQSGQHYRYSAKLGVKK